MELDIDNYCKVGWSPKTVLSSPQHQKKGGCRSRKGRFNSQNDDYDLISFEGERFTEIKFRNYQSVSCKNLPSEDVELDCNEVLSRRGSVYQSSTQRESGRPETRGGRQKVEFSVGSETQFSFSILDSICGSEEEAEVEPEQQRSSLLSLNLDSVSSADLPIQPFFMDLKERQNDWGSSAERGSMQNEKFECEQIRGPSNNANVLTERDSLALNKSLSAKLIIPHSPIHSEGDSTKRIPKARLKTMFDPFTKSKSHRIPSKDAKSSSLADIGKSKTLRKSFLHDYSSVVPNVESRSPGLPPVKKEQQLVVPPCSPAHLRGNLKMEQKHGVPYFEFTMEHSEDLLVAKTWKAENSLNWVYTFHSIHGRKRSSANGWGMKYSNKDSPMVGQMQVTCCLCSELEGGGASSNSMMTEFVLYDIAHASKSVINEEDSNSTENANVLCVSGEYSAEGNIELVNMFLKPRPPVTSVADRRREDGSSPYPWAPTDLRPSFEIAAVVVQAPFEKRESLKYKRGDELSDQVTVDMCDDRNLVKVNVVTPLGNHGLPAGGESRGPSPLLDRWRLGGGCDCGGWDMACPLVVFGNPRMKCVDEQSLLQKDQPLQLYAQGGKGVMPALTIAIIDKGRYTVDFHAQLSILQTFAVCVAIMHTTEASSLVEQEKSKELLQCSSLKVLVEDDVKILIEAVKEEEKKKAAKVVEGHHPSFVLNPPFSPIARV